jgi:uroporphyrinogen III methyltransferase/synthase
MLVTRAQAQASSFSQLLESKGAEVTVIPTIQIRPRPTSELDQAALASRNYNWLFLTSTNAAEIFLDRVRALRLDALPAVCTIGPATAKAVQSRGWNVALVPETYQAEGVVESFTLKLGSDLSNIRILLPRASKARNLLPEALRRQGAEIDVIPIYDTIIPEEYKRQLRDFLDTTTPDLVTFTSSSTVHHFATLAKDHPKLQSLRCAAIGPITAETAADYGLKIVVEPRKSTVPELAEAILEYFREKD